MARRVHLHIGTMKAATTYVQAMLDANRNRLSDAGVLWSGSRRNHQAVAHLLNSPRWSGGDACRWDEFAREINAHDGIAVVSVELLAQARQRKIQQLVESLHGADVHVVLTARNLARVLPSHWQELVQNRRMDAWADYVSEVCADEGGSEIAQRFWRHHDIPEILGRWTSYVPGEATTVVVVPNTRSEPHIVWERFLSALDLKVHTTTQARFANRSLGVVSTELIRRVNAETASLDWATYRYGIKQALGKQVLANRSGQGPRPGIPPGQYAWLRARAEQMVHEIDGLGATIIGDKSDLLLPPEPADEGIDPSQIEETTLYPAAFRALVEVTTRLGQERADGERLRRQNAQLKAELDSAAHRVVRRARGGLRRIRRRR